MPDTRQYKVLSVFALGLPATAGLGALAALPIAAGPGYPLEAALVFGGVLAAMLGIAGGAHPYHRFGPANLATTIRAILVSLVVALIVQRATAEAAWLAIALTSVAAALDGVDGWLARRTGMVSEFGARFDMETDALLVMALSALVWQHDKAGAWVLLCGLMRYAFVAAGWPLPWLARPLRSTRRGKTVAVAQFVGLSAALAPVVPSPESAVVAAVTLAALAWSFALDVRWLARAS